MIGKLDKTVWQSEVFDEDTFKQEFLITAHKRDGGLISRTIIYRPDTMDIVYFTTAVHMLLRRMIGEVEEDDDQAETKRREAAISVAKSFVPRSDVAPKVFGK